MMARASADRYGRHASSLRNGERAAQGPRPARLQRARARALPGAPFGAADHGTVAAPRPPPPQVEVKLKQAGKKLEHYGIKVEFIGQIGASAAPSARARTQTNTTRKPPTLAGRPWGGAGPLAAEV